MTCVIRPAFVIAFAKDRGPQSDVQDVMAPRNVAIAMEREYDNGTNQIDKSQDFARPLPHHHACGAARGGSSFGSSFVQDDVSI